MGKTKLTAYINGKFVSEEKASISVFDRGFSYGDGLFETIRARDGKPLLLAEHLQRLRAGAQTIRLPKKALNTLLVNIDEKLIARLLKANGLTDNESYVKIIVTRGVDRGGHLPSSGLNPTVIIMTKPLDPAFLERVRAKGLKAALIRGFAPALPTIKSLNYLSNVLARMEADDAGADEGLFTTPKGRVTEGTSTNLFIVLKGILRTPLLAKEALLPGTTRDAVMGIARENGITVTEGIVSVAGLLACEEAFLTNAIIGAAPLVRVDKSLIGAGRRGPITKRLQGLYFRKY
ncbi:MAG: aminotransferase class IV [Deltaproteobacteria bacterium]|nr:aminotransferase class IV [Deltaproteobacteria bacterium]